MHILKDVVRNRIILTVLTSAAGAIGTVLLAEYPAIHQAVCF